MEETRSNSSFYSQHLCFCFICALQSETKRECQQRRLSAFFFANLFTIQSNVIESNWSYTLFLCVFMLID